MRYCLSSTLQIIVIRPGWRLECLELTVLGLNQIFPGALTVKLNYFVLLRSPHWAPISISKTICLQPHELVDLITFRSKILTVHSPKCA